MADKLDKMREKLEKIMYDIAVYMAEERGLSYRMIRDNPIDYIHKNDGFGMDFMYNDDESYVFNMGMSIFGYVNSI